MRAGTAADRDPVLDPARVAVDAQDLAGRAGSRPRPSSPPTATPETPRPSRSGSPMTVRVAGVDPREGAVAGAGHPDRALARSATRSGPWPTAIGVGDRDAVAAEQDGATTTAIAATISDRRSRQPAPSPAPRRRRRPGRAARRDRRGRPARGVGEHPGRGRRRALVLARGLDQRARGRVALGRVLGDRAFDHRVEPLRHLRLGVRPPGARRGRSRSAPRRGRSRASRRRRPGPTLFPCHCSGDMYSTVPAIEAPSRTPLSPSALARPKSVRKARSPSIRMLCGLTSRWTMPAAWAASSASATWPSSSIASRRAQRAAGGDPPLQVAALDQPHRDDQLAVLLAGVVDGDDARVVEPGGEPRLAQEPLAEALVVGEVAGDHLERHRPVEGEVGRPVDDAHPAARDQRVDPVPAESRADCRFCHAAVIPPPRRRAPPPAAKGPLTGASAR